MGVRVQSEAFDSAALLKDFGAGAGAVVTFTGRVRNNGANDLLAMEIEHYPGMTEKALAAIEGEAKERWGLVDSLVVHRFGALRPDEDIMMVATAARHRKAAFEAAEFLMDYLKSRAPFWKREHTTTGSSWVAATKADEDALGRW